MKIINKYKKQSNFLSIMKHKKLSYVAFETKKIEYIDQLDDC